MKKEKTNKKEKIKLNKENKTLKETKIKKSTIELEETKPENNKTTENLLNKQENKIYISYTARVCFYFMMFVLAFISCTYYLFKSITYEEEKSYNYKEHGYIENYKYNLKPGNFYEKEYIDKNDKIIPISNYINNIVLDFVYKFDIDTKIDGEFSYDIIADLNIIDERENKNYYKKRFVIKPNVQKKIEKENSYVIKESINIDYNYFNNIANNIKNELNGINSKSELNVKMLVNKKDLQVNKNTKINGNNNIEISIPLTEKAIDVKLIPNDVNNKKEIYSKAIFSVNKILYFILFILFVILTNYMLIKFIRLISKIKPKRNKYDELVKRLLTEYDRLIVETTTEPNLTMNNIIKVTKFEELLDVRDNLKKPILHFEVNKHEKCYFFIRNDNDIYLLILKAVDINK